MQWSWIEFFNNLFSSVLAGLILAAFLGIFGYLSTNYIRRYIRRLFHAEIQLELAFNNSSGVMERIPTNGRYVTTYFRLMLKNKSGTAVNLEHAYLHLIVDTATSNLGIDARLDTKIENGLVHFQIPLKGLIPKGSFGLEYFLQNSSTTFFLGNNVSLPLITTDLPVYYFFQTSTAYYPEGVTFNEDDSVVTESCKKIIIRLMPTP
jgi:hypothetical protein